MSDVKNTRIAIVDNNELFRKGIRKILLNIEWFEVVFDGTSTNELLQSAVHAPDIILFDQMVYDNSPLDQMKMLVNKYPQATLGLFITNMDSHDVSKAIELNVLGYLTKKMEVCAFSEALEELNKNRHWVSEHIIHGFFSEYR